MLNTKRLSGSKFASFISTKFVAAHTKLKQYTQAKQLNAGCDPLACLTAA
jgi:hypothetical protein